MEEPALEVPLHWWLHLSTHVRLHCRISYEGNGFQQLHTKQTGSEERSGRNLKPVLLFLKTNIKLSFGSWILTHSFWIKPHIKKKWRLVSVSQLCQFFWVLLMFFEHCLFWDVKNNYNNLITIFTSNRPVYMNAQLEFGGNWTTDGNLMLTSSYSDLRQSGSWPPSASDVVNTTGLSWVSSNLT